MEKKHTIKTSIAMLLLCLLPTGVMAQGDEDVPAPCQSTWEHYSNINESTSHVRSDNNYRVIHSEYDETYGVVRHTFVIQDFYTGNEAYYTTYFNSSAYGGAYIHIHDMELYNGECYFCGQYVFEYGMIPEDYYDGVVGHFSPHDLMTNNNGIYFYRVPKTYTLSKLAITGSQSFQELVSAVGVEDDQTTACLVELRHTAGQPWKAFIGHNFESPKLFFADILATADSLTLLAQIQCINNYPHSHPDYDVNHQVFVIDRASRNGFLTDYCSTSISHYMMHFLTPYTELANFHTNCCPMLLYPSNSYEDFFGVAYGVKETGSNDGGIRLFHFFDKMWYNGSIYYKTGPYAQIIDIGSLGGEDNRPFLLSRDNSHPYHLLSVPVWNASPIVYKYYGAPYMLNSLAQRRSQHYIDISCHGTDDMLNLFKQDVDSLHYISCFEAEVSNCTEFEKRHGALLDARWEYILDNQEFNWVDAAIVEYAAIKPEKICEKCYGDNNF